MVLVNLCSRILARSVSRPLSTRSLIPSLPKWYKGKQSGTKFNYSYGAIGLLGAAICGVGAALADGQISADELELGHGHMHWEHKELNKSHDHKALRRGFQVYREVCQACHNLDYMYWRTHIGVTHTKEEVKEMAAEYRYKEEFSQETLNWVPVVNDDGDQIERPGDIQDIMPRPYENDIKARLANNGAEPPDLTLMTIGREGGEDYLFSLLTGYEEVPAGQAEPAEGQAYNPYFHGYYLGMPQQLYNESVDYEDGTIPYQSQIAKDVIQYLAWTAQPWMDESKMYGMKACASAAVLVLCGYYLMRTRRNNARLRQVHFTVPGHEAKIAKNANVNNFSKYQAAEYAKYNKKS